MKIKLGAKQKECEFHFEEVEGFDIAILDTIDGENVEDMLPSDYEDYERYLKQAIEKGEHLDIPLEEESFYKDLTD